MPRRKRHIVPGVIYHLISRFVDKRWFVETDRDRKLYLDLLGKALEHSTWQCFGFAIMSNHIHLAMLAGTEPLAEWIRAVHSPFADTRNRSLDRIGPVFVRGPQDVLVPESRLVHLLGYIHNNPVRAGVVEHAALSTWTSHRAYIGAVAAPSWLAVDEGLRRSGVPRASFDAVVRSTTSHPVLGEVKSDEHLEELVDAYERQQAATREAQVSGFDDVQRVVAAVADAMGISSEQLRSRRRSSTEVRARAAVIACGAQLGCSTRSLADALGLTPQAVNKHIRCASGDGIDIVSRTLRSLRDGGE